MKSNHPHKTEINAFIGSIKEIKTILAEDWKKLDEEAIILLQEEVQDINDAIKRLLRKQND